MPHIEGTNDMRRALPAVLLALGLGACAAPYTAYPAVPPPREERIPAPPVSASVLSWQPGHYDWDGVRYTWVEGRWVDRAGHGSLWQDGFWRRDQNDYVWVPAHWM